MRNFPENHLEVALGIFQEFLCPGIFLVLPPGVFLELPPANLYKVSLEILTEGSLMIFDGLIDWFFFIIEILSPW